MRNYIVGLAVIFSAESWASSYSVNYNGLTQSEKSEALNLVTAVMNVLPQKMKDSLNDRPVAIHFKKMTDMKRMGEYNKLLSVISLNKQLLNNDLNTERLMSSLRDINISIKHESAKKFKMAALIHEMAHHYDEGNFEGKAFQNNFPSCPTRSPREQGVTIPLICQIKEDSRTTVSTRPWFLEASGFQYLGFLGSSRKMTNNLYQRSADPYEMNSSKEFFAINLEYFLLDEEFVCRKPFLHEVFAKYFEMGSLKNKVCALQGQLYEQNIVGLNQEMAFFNLDPSRIYDLHYFFAGKGEASMSRFGHAMLRIIICRPGRIKGPDCVKDISYHKVISFQALAGNNIDVLKGLKGGYDSSTPIYSLNDMIQQYTETELREISSYPFHLTKEKINLLSKLIVEKFWTYSGDYKFLSNNCADETLNFIKALFYDQPKTWGLVIMRPDTLASLLEKSALITKHELTNSDLAHSEGFYFPSKKVAYDKFLKILKNKSLVNKTFTLQGYIESPVEMRESMIAKIEDFKFRDLPSVAAAIQLERIIFANKQAELWNKFKTRMSESVRVNEDQEKRLNAFINPPGKLLSLDRLRYGVPDEDELDELKNALQENINTPETMQDSEDVEDYFLKEINERKKIVELNLRLIKKYKELRQ